MNFAGLERRVSNLEGPSCIKEDSLGAILDTLADTDLGIICEYGELVNAGFSQEEIEEMMGTDTYEKAQAIADMVQDELAVQQFAGAAYRTGKKPRTTKPRKKNIHPR
ncbi:MAG TPA: hypothetical protein PK738_04920 [Bacteroidales bacterium]|nr:hypothetical protein [Bacteroidales bacterium]